MLNVLGEGLNYYNKLETQLTIGKYNLFRSLKKLSRKFLEFNLSMIFNKFRNNCKIYWITNINTYKNAFFYYYTLSI